MSRRLDIYIHQPARNARETRRTRDANQAYDIKVRRLATGSDFSIRLFAASQEDAEKRAKERARSAYGISIEKYRESESKGNAVFRIVESKVSPDQSRPNTDSKSFADSIGALIGGEHRPEGKHAKNTPLVADAEYRATKLSTGWQVERLKDGKRCVINDRHLSREQAIEKAMIDGDFR